MWDKLDFTGLTVMVPRGAVYRLAIKRIDMTFFIVDLANNRWQSLIELQGETGNDGDVNAVFSYYKKAVGDKRVEQLLKTKLT